MRSKTPSPVPRIPAPAVRVYFPTRKRKSYFLNLSAGYQAFCTERGATLTGLSRYQGKGRLALHITCCEGHRFKVASRYLSAGSWCPQCKTQSAYDRQLLALKRLKAIATERGGRLLTDVYRNARTLMDWECHRFHRWSATPDNVTSKGSWCMECHLEALFAARDRAHRRRRRTRSTSP